jgi:hypothetical protein
MEALIVFMVEKESAVFASFGSGYARLGEFPLMKGD